MKKRDENLHVRINSEMKQRLVEIADEANLSVSQLVVQLIADEIKRNKRRNKES